MTRYTPSRFWDRRLFKGTKKVVGEFSTSPEGPARLSSGAKARLKKLHRKQWSYFTRQLSIFFARQAIIIKQRRALWAHLPFIKNWPVGDRDWSRNSQKGIYVYYHPLGTWGEAEVLFSGSGTHSSSFSTRVTAWLIVWKFAEVIVNLMLKSTLKLKVRGFKCLVRRLLVHLKLPSLTIYNILSVR